MRSASLPEPRVARTVYIEMVEPGTESDNAELSERVTDYIATAIELEVGAAQAGGSEPVDGDPEAEVDSPLIFESEDSGALPQLDGYGADTPFFYRDFPSGADFFERIDDGRVWDSMNQRIWIETDEPGRSRQSSHRPDSIPISSTIIPASSLRAAPSRPRPKQPRRSPLSRPMLMVEAAMAAQRPSQRRRLRSSPPPWPSRSTKRRPGADRSSSGTSRHQAKARPTNSGCATPLTTGSSASGCYPRSKMDPNASNSTCSAPVSRRQDSS